MPHSVGDQHPRRRTRARDRPEELADEAVQRPARGAIRAARLADASRWSAAAGRRVRTSSRSRRHRVEGAVGEQQRLRVSLEQGDVEILCGCTLAAALEQRRDVVDARSPWPSGQRRSPRCRSGCDVGSRQPASGRRCRRGAPRRHDAGRDDVEVAARPRLLLTLLYGGEVGDVVAVSVLVMVSCPARPAVASRRPSTW